MKLTGQQEKFAVGVASGKTQADAYREAYPKAKKWKDDAVYVEASRLLDNPKVSLRLKELRERITGLGIASAERTLLEATRIALFDPRNLFFDDGTPKPITALDDDTAAALAGLDVVEEFEGSGEDRKFVGYTKKYKVADKNSALEKLFKHHGLYERDNQQKTDPIADMLKSISGSFLPVVKGDGG